MLHSKAEQYGLIIHAYCLMTNHVHIAATPSQYKGMRWQKELQSSEDDALTGAIRHSTFKGRSRKKTADELD